MDGYRGAVGDDACWLDRTCLSCGRFLDADEAESDACPHCGTDRIVKVDPPPEARDPS